MSNRIQERIDSIQKRIDAKQIPAEKLDDLRKNLATPWKELVEYQNLQASAHAAGKITTEEARTVYELLGGENPSEKKWNELSLAAQTAITQLMSDLLEWRIKLGPGQVVLSRTIPVKHEAPKKRAPRKSRPGGLGGMR